MIHTVEKKRRCGFFCPFLEAQQKNLQICRFLRDRFLFAGEVVPHSSCYHIVSPRDKPTEPQSLNLSALFRTNKKYRKPDSRAGEGYHSRTSQYSDLFAGAGGMRMGSLYLSLESGFLCFTALPDGLVPHLRPASVSFPPRSPGERTEK